MDPKNYFGFNLNDFYDQKNKSMILTSNENPDSLVIFSLYDGKSNMVIYYDNPDDWGYQVLPKEEVKELYLDFRRNGFIPLRK